MSTACGSGRTTRMLEAALEAVSPKAQVNVICHKCPALEKWIKRICETRTSIDVHSYMDSDVLTWFGNKIEIHYSVPYGFDWDQRCIPGYSPEVNKYFIDHEVIERKIAQLRTEIDTIRRQIQRLNNTAQY